MRSKPKDEKSRKQASLKGRQESRAETLGDGRSASEHAPGPSLPEPNATAPSTEAPARAALYADRCMEDGDPLASLAHGTHPLPRNA